MLCYNLVYYKLSPAVASMEVSEYQWLRTDQTGVG